MSLARKSMEELLQEFARTSPTVPAGGCAVGLAGAVAASLGRFVAALSRRRAEDIEWIGRLEAMEERLEVLQQRCLLLMDEDMDACKGLFRARSNRGGSQSPGGMEEVGRALMEPAVALGRYGIELLRISLELIRRGDPLARADAGVAAEIAHACAKGGLWIARANLAWLGAEDKRVQAQELDHFEVEMESLYNGVCEEMEVWGIGRKLQGGAHLDDDCVLL